MKRTCICILFALVLALFVAGSAYAETIDPELQDELERLRPGEMARVIIRMAEQPHGDLTMDADMFFNILRETAERTQFDLLGYLQTKQAVGKVEVFTNFWLVNVVFAEATAEVIREIAPRPDVAFVYKEFKVAIDLMETVPEIQEQAWDNVGFVQAPQAWAEGYRGQGIKVAVTDTGVDITHPELDGAMGGSPPYYEGYWVEFDSNGNVVPGSTPHDTHGHGTHVSGTSAGRNVVRQIGVAPEATIGHALILPLPGGKGTSAQLLAGLQWTIDPNFDGDPTDRYHASNQSWGVTGIWPDLAMAIANMAAAGVFPACSIGNCGEGCHGAPGNTPKAEGVGAFTMTGDIVGFSSGGLVTYPDYPAYIKPDISAPGVSIWSSLPGGGYANCDGTSMASPHVNGTVALMLSKNPGLTVAEIRDILHDSVGGHPGLPDDAGDPDQDTRYGWGRLNAYRAVLMTPAP